MTGEKRSTNEELQKRHDHGFGRAVKGFRTVGDAMAFAKRWNALKVPDVRELYPAQTRGMGDTEVGALHYQIFTEIRGKGVEGLKNALGGSLDSLERILRAGTEIVIEGTIVKGGAGKAAVMSASTLGRDVFLDIYIYGTGPTGIPDWESFVRHRKTKAYYFKLQEHIEDWKHENDWRPDAQ